MSDGSNMRIRLKRSLFVLICITSTLIMYYLMDLIGGAPAIHSLKNIVLLKEGNSRQFFSIHKEAHEHNEEIPFVLRDEPSLPKVLERKPYYNKSIVRVGYDVQFGNDDVQNLKLPLKEKKIGIGCAITTRGQWEPQFQPERLTELLPFFKGLLPSFCRTASYGFDYHFYMAHDHEDPFFAKNYSHHYFKQAFYGEVERACPYAINVTLHMIECHHSGNYNFFQAFRYCVNFQPTLRICLGHPAWAQNDAMMGAYMDDMAYYYRVNDDTVMETGGWTEKMIEQLLRSEPTNVGVAGPWFKEGN